MTPYVMEAACDMDFERRLRRLAEAKKRSDEWKKSHPDQACSPYSFLMPDTGSSRTEDME